MPDITKVDLSRYRFQKAEEMLASAKRDMEADDFASANNRAYYAIFHAMRAVLALDGEDFKKHSAGIARFTLNYLDFPGSICKYNSFTPFHTKKS